MPRGIVALVFCCKAEAGALRETEESASFRWVTADEAFAIRVQAGFHDWKWASGWERRPLGFSTRRPPLAVGLRC